MVLFSRYVPAFKSYSCLNILPIFLCQCFSHLYLMFFLTSVFFLSGDSRLTVSVWRTCHTPCAVTPHKLGAVQVFFFLLLLPVGQPFVAITASNACESFFMASATFLRYFGLFHSFLAMSMSWQARYCFGSGGRARVIRENIGLEG